MGKKMENKKQKLELTWIGKDEVLRLEPRILIEDPDKSYGDPRSENMLVHGDNLLALKALEQDFANRIKCIYIDPPYNTGSKIDSDGEEIGYEDGLEHSEWLNLMKPRLEILKNLLHQNGTLAVQIDDNEFARLYLLMVEIFQERNLKVICVKMSEPTGVKMAHVINSGRITRLKEYIILARKDGIRDLFVEKIPKEKWDNEYKTLIGNITQQEIGILKDIRENEERTEFDVEECDRILSKMIIKPLSECYREHQITDEKRKIEFNFENAWRIVQTVSMSGGAKIIADEKRKINSNQFFSIVTPQKKMYFIRNEYDPKIEIPRIKIIFADDYLTVHPGDFWGDIKTTGLDNEGGVKFKKGKKPEALIKRIIGMASQEGDLVLDSFAGSGTTGAVAQKMKRKWIMVEMAVHIYSHLIPRIQRVISGEDNQGISESVNWTGGGGFRFYNLAPSLLRKDSYGNFVIDERYNPNMLAAAMCKHEGFKYYPDEALYWKQGKSTETDYIFVTTSFVTVEQLDKIHSEMKEDESLLICAKSFASECEKRFANITIKKIPNMILGKCEFGKDNYDLNIINATKVEAEE
jgi:adenine-specific DNA-methyltransferase